MSKPPRRRGLAPLAVLAALLLAPAARAQVVGLPPGVPPGGVRLQNPTRAALPPRPTSFGTGFARGALPAGGTLSASIGGHPVAAQLDVHATWDDGSARWASVTVAAPALPPGGAVAVALSPASGGAPGTTLPWAAPALGVTLLGSTLDLGAALRNAPDAWLRGPLAVQRRVDLPVPGDAGGALHLVADVTCLAGGGVVADVQLRRDVATVQESSSATVQTPLPPLSYDLAVTLDGRTTTEHVAAHELYQDWHLVLGETAVNVQHDVAALVEAGLVPPYDLRLGVSEAPGTVYAAERTALGRVGWGAPLALNDVTPGMNTTGGRADIGVTTAANAIWLRTQEDAARRFALGQADAGGAVPWHFWNARAGRWWDVADAPQLWATAKQGNYAQYFTHAMPPQGAGQPWDVAASHAPNLDYVPALLTGSRFWRDMQQAQATAVLALSWPPNRAPTNDVIFGGVEVRSVAWTYREVVEAMALADPGSVPLAHLQGFLRHSWDWWNAPAQAPAWATREGETALYVPDRYTPGTMAPWEQDYLVGVVALGATLGDPGAAARLPDVASARIGALLPHPGWDPADALTSTWHTVDPSGRTARTWAELGALIAAAGAHHTAAQNDSYGDYASLARLSLAAFLHVHPGDELARAALSGLLGALRGPASNVGAESYRRSLVQEGLAVPAGVEPSGSWGR